jgi:hypothetical protein
MSAQARIRLPESRSLASSGLKRAALRQARRMNDVKDARTI